MSPTDLIDQALDGLAPGPARDNLERAKRQVELHRYKMAYRYVARALVLLHTQEALERAALAYAACYQAARA